MYVPRILYSLACDHAATGPSTLVSGMLFCPFDQDHSQIVGVITHEWRAKCVTCGWARWTGNDAGTAGYLANGHYHKHVGHVVTPEYALNPTAVATAGKMDEWNGKKR